MDSFDEYEYEEEEAKKQRKETQQTIVKRNFSLRPLEILKFKIYKKKVNLYNS